MGTTVRRSDDAAWQHLARGPEAGERLRAVWREALASNPALPDRLRIRLLEAVPGLLWRRDLSPAVVDAAVGHPDRRVRGALVEYRGMHGPGLTADQWSRILVRETGARLALILECAAERGAELTGPAYEALAAHPSAAVRAEAARLAGLPRHLHRGLLTDPEPRVRAAACAAVAWAELDSGAWAALLADPEPAVRRAVLLARHEEAPLTAEDIASLGDRPRAYAGEYRLERSLAERLCADADPATRRELAGNPFLDPGLVAVLAADPEDDVRLAVSVRPELTEEERAAVRVETGPERTRYPLPWVVAQHEDAEAMRRLAASAHPLVRSSVAMARRLPPDVAELLARDEDRVVRLFLAEHCDDAPTEMLLEVWQWWNGSLSVPDRPYGHPNFPRRDLLRHATARHPRLRQLALDDPDSPPALVERFSRDEDPEVRRRAATDPRLSPQSLVRLLDDPDGGVRDTAARNPRLPVPVLVALLGDERTAAAAARNPAIPEAAMVGMTEGCGPA
jgi:hypothetical protein